ncbi:cardiolipin synthase [Nocardioides sp.]|uniref:cardiolipin synthase n=1 Tax=Nocardioides sp. TaxID=35761 RepID=UPI002605E6D6|nr:cardiolipin synthase [Nocardioides sp.]
MPALPAVISALLVVLDVALVIGALFVLPGGRRPQTAMAWVLLITVFPLGGFLIFLTFGRTSVGRKRRQQQEEINADILAAVPWDEVGDDSRADDLPPLVRRMVHLNRELAALPLTHGNSVHLIEDYAGSLEEMRAAIEQAREYVHVQFYISAWDDLTSPVFEAMLRAVQRGVTVRFLYDHLGSRGIPVYRELLRRLEGTGIQSAPMLPIMPLKGEMRRPDLRNHRKILVVDGLVGFSGSQNLIEPGYDKPKNHRIGREWVDLMARLQGPAVRELDVVFATDWFKETGEDLRTLFDLRTEVAPVREGDLTDVGVQVVPSGPGFASENNLRLFNAMIYSAERRVSLTSPYFVPDDSLLYAVTTAAQRGVETELFVSEAADQFMVAHAQSSYYETLLDAGVRIWLYPEPYVLHAKHFTVDDSVAIVGSSNMDIRSFALNYEVVMMMTGPEIVRRLEAVQDGYRSLSRELTLEEWKARGRGRRAIDNLMRLTATLQ